MADSQSSGKNHKKGKTNMKTAKVLIILTLVVVVVAFALLLVGTTSVGRELLVDLVESNVDGHPTIDGIVESIPSDCLECHERGNDVGAFNEIGP
jgi:hypothetical protein